MMKEPENAAPGTAAPQCGNPGTAAPQCGNPGTAAPQCGNYDDKSVESRTGVRRSQEGSQEGSQTHSREHPREWYSRGYLPHFDSPNVIQHITYRLADSLPRTMLEQMQVEVETLVRDDEKRKSELRRRIETYLDAGHGSCVLRVPEIAACVVDTWLHFDGERYRLLEWVVMPNHCHVLIEPFEDVPLGKIVLSWKNYTARFINGYKSRTGVRRSQEGSPVWQREYWDRFIRDERHFEAAKSYITLNPVKVGLVAQPEDWPWGSARVRGKPMGKDERRKKAALGCGDPRDSYSEDALVEQPAIALLAALGWETVNAYHELADDCERQAAILCLKNTTLRRTRDLLLPKLISGEVDVSKLDIAVPEEASA